VFYLIVLYTKQLVFDAKFLRKIAITFKNVQGFNKL